MRNAAQQAQASGLFLKTAVVLWVLALCGAFLALPYVATLEHKALAAAAVRTHLEVRELLAISVAQTAVLLAIAAVGGQWAARKLGLGTPLIAAFLTRRPAPERTPSTLSIAFALGTATALALIILDHWVFAPNPSVAELIRNAETGSAKPSAWQGLLASFYGALDEEILIRLGLMSLVALAFRTMARILGADRELALPTGVFWAANIVTAVIFGLGHLPATAALAPLSVALVVRAVVLNGTAGLLFGLLYRLNLSLRGPRNDDRSRGRSINGDPARDGNTLDRRRLVRSSDSVHREPCADKQRVKGRTAPPVPTTSVVPLIRCADLRCTQVIEARFVPDGQSVRSQPLPQDQVAWFHHQ